MSALQNYTDNWSEDDVNKEIADTKQERADESDFLSIKDGNELAVRVPPNPKGGTPFVKFAKHFYPDPTTGKMVSFACPAKTKVPTFSPYECPTCLQAAVLRRSRIQMERDLGFKMRAKTKALVNVLVRPSDEAIQHARDEGLAEPKGKVKLWEISSWTGDKNGKNMHERLLAIRTNRRIGGNFVDPTDAGFDLLIGRDGEGINTRYEVNALRGEKRALLPDLKDAEELIENGQIDIEWFITPPTTDELQAILQGEKPQRGGEKKGGQRRISGGGGSADPEVLPAGETAGGSIGDDYGAGGATGQGF